MSDLHASEPIDPAASKGAARVVLEARGLFKRFDAVRALDGVDFSLRAGEIHALMGENGAGKSTLVKCLTGVHRADAGEIVLDGVRIAPGSPRDAERVGISTVYQEVNLIPHMSVAENICLGREPVRCLLRGIRWGEVRERARAALGRLGLSIDVSRELGSCSIAVQQLVAIARALDVDARVIILDEPTSSLDREEAARLLGVMARLREQGLGVVFITHFLEQVEAITDRVTILRDGRTVGVHETRGLARSKLVNLMVGREFEAVLGAAAVRESAAAGTALVKAEGIGRVGSVEHVDLEVHAGETVGLVGLLGSGRTETARLLFGADQIDHGRLEVDGREVRPRSPRRAIGLGLAMTPEDRRRQGILPNLSVRENIVLALQARRGLARRLSRAEQVSIADRFISALGIKTPTAETPVSRLSGGNQQKVLLARWLAIEPRVLILDEPTRGIDVGAKAEILRATEELRTRGMGILMISSELEEVVRLASRLVVLRDRRSIGELTGTDRSEEKVLAMIAHHPPHHPPPHSASAHA